MRNSLIFLSGFLLLYAPWYVRAAGMDDTFIYAWSENLGWINMNPPLGEVAVTDTGMSGYAWNEHVGWISFFPSSTTSAENNGEGNLSGYAWGEGTGYVDFDGVHIDDDGFFHGYASSSAFGRISFNCANTNSCASSNFKVRTDWRPPSESSESSSGSGNGGGGNGPIFASATTAFVEAFTDNDHSPEKIAHDGHYDVLDFNQIMVMWGFRGKSVADLTGDDVVDLLDFNQLMVMWT